MAIVPQEATKNNIVFWQFPAIIPSGNITRQRLADAANVPYTTLRNIETKRGTSVMAAEATLQLLAAVLGVPFDELRILAGYQITASDDELQRKRRIAAQIESHPALSRALNALLHKNDADEIDRAATYIEWVLQRKKD